MTLEFLIATQCASFDYLQTTVNEWNKSHIECQVELKNDPMFFGNTELSVAALAVEEVGQPSLVLVSKDMAVDLIQRKVISFNEIFENGSADQYAFPFGESSIWVMDNLRTRKALKDVRAFLDFLAHKELNGAHHAQAVVVPVIERLDECDKTSCLEILRKAEVSELLHAILNLSAKLLAPHDARFLSEQKFWRDATDVLDLGSRNGTYLQLLSTFFNDKRYVGIEKKPELLLQARQNFTSPHLTFREGDLETLHEDLKGQYDIVYIRMALEYLKQPSLTLEHAHSYLRKGGHVIIIDAYDPAMRVSREVPIINETVRLHNEKNKAEDKGNRKVTLEVLDGLKNRSSGLSELYDVVFTNLDENGKILQELYRTQGPRDRKLSFTMSMLYLAIMNKGWGIPVDLSRGYDELHMTLEDENSWCAPGLHYIVLKKK